MYTFCILKCIDNAVFLNAATSFLDASPIYNSVSCEASTVKVTKSQSGHLKKTPCSRFVCINFYKKYAYVF